MIQTVDECTISVLVVCELRKMLSKAISGLESTFWETYRFRGDSTWYFIFMKRVAVNAFYNRVIINNHNNNRNILLVYTKVSTACQWKAKLFPVGIISTFYMNFWSGVQQITTSTHEHEKTFHLSRLHLVAAFGHRLHRACFGSAVNGVCSRLNGPLLLVMGL